MIWRDFKLIVNFYIDTSLGWNPWLLDKCAKIFHWRKTQARTMVSTAGGWIFCCWLPSSISHISGNASLILWMLFRAWSAPGTKSEWPNCHHRLYYLLDYVAVLHNKWTWIWNYLISYIKCIDSKLELTKTVWSPTTFALATFLTLSSKKICRRCDRTVMKWFLEFYKK